MQSENSSLQQSCYRLIGCCCPCQRTNVFAVGLSFYSTSNLVLNYAIPDLQRIVAMAAGNANEARRSQRNRSAKNRIPASSHAVQPFRVAGLTCGAKPPLRRARQLRTRARLDGIEFPAPIHRARAVKTRAQGNRIEFPVPLHRVMAAMHRAPAVKTRAGSLRP